MSIKKLQLAVLEWCPTPTCPDSASILLAGGMHSQPVAGSVGQSGSRSVIMGSWSDLGGSRIDMERRVTPFRFCIPVLSRYYAQDDIV